LNPVGENRQISVKEVVGSLKHFMGYLRLARAFGTDALVLCLFEITLGSKFIPKVDFNSLSTIK